MKMNVKGNDNFQTPDHIFKQLNDIFNFTLDAACTTENCKCKYGFGFDDGINALEVSWGGVSRVLQSAVQPKGSLYQKGL